MRNQLFFLLALAGLGSGCGYAFDPMAEGIYPCDPTDTVTTPQCLDDFTCSDDGFCVLPLEPTCAASENGDTRCNADAVQLCDDGQWIVDQICGDYSMSCVEVFQGTDTIFACREP